MRQLTKFILRFIGICFCLPVFLLMDLGRFYFGSSLPQVISIYCVIGGIILIVEGVLERNGLGTILSAIMAVTAFFSIFTSLPLFIPWFSAIFALLQSIKLWAEAQESDASLFDPSIIVNFSIGAVVTEVIF